MNRFGAEMVLLGVVPVPSLIPKWAMISINCSEDKFLAEGKDLNKMERNGLEMLMSIRFDDIKFVEYERIKAIHPKIILFNEDHARKVIEFVELAQKRPEPMSLLIHCTAGVSRSGAVAAFISEYLNISFHDENIMPNSHILETLRNTAKAYDIIKKGDGDENSGSARS